MNDLTYKKMGRDIHSLVLEATLPDRILNDEEIRDEIILLNSQVNNETDNGWYIKNTNYNIGLVFNNINTYNKFINVVNIIKKYSINRLEKRNGSLLDTPDFVSFIITEDIGDIKRDELKTLYETRVDYEAVLYDLNDSYNETYIRALNKAFRSNIFAYVLHVSDMSRQALEELEMRYKLMLKDIKSKSLIHTNTKDELYVYEFALRNAMTYTKESTEDYDEIRDLIIQIAEDLKLQKEMIDLLIQNMPELHHSIDDTDDKAVTPKAVMDYVQDVISGNIELPVNILTDENITHELGGDELKVISQKGFTEALNDVKNSSDITSLDNKIDDVEGKLQSDINTKFDVNSLHHKVDNTRTKPVTPQAVKEAIEGISGTQPLPDDILTKDSITNELGDSPDKIASQKLVNEVNQKTRFDEVCTEKLKVLSDCDGWGWYSSATPMTIPGLFTRYQNQDYNIRFPKQRSGTFALDEDLQEKRDKSDVSFNNPIQLHSTDDTGTGLFMFCPEKKLRGHIVYNSYGLQFTQVQEDGTAQTFTFPRYGNGGEIITKEVLDDVIQSFEKVIDKQHETIDELNIRLEKLENNLLNITWRIKQ